MSVPTPSPATAALLEQLTAVAEQDPAGLSETQALADAAALLGAADRLQGLALAWLADVDDRQLFSLQGCRSVGSWLDRHGLQVERSQVALARRLHRLPVVARALRQEQVTVSQAVLIGRALDTLGPHLDRPDATIDGQPSAQVLPAVIIDGVLSVLAEGRGGFAEDDPQLPVLRRALVQTSQGRGSETDRLAEAFTFLARHLDPALLRSALAALVGALLPNELDKAAEDAEHRRALTLTRQQGGSGWLVRGELTPEAGELLHTALHAAMLTDPANPADTAAAAGLIAAHPEQDPQDLRASRFAQPGGPRRRSQRMHDALALLLRRLLDGGELGRRGRVAPHLGVLVSLPPLHGDPGALPARGDSGALLPASLVRTWWCDSQVTRIVLSAGRRVLEVSHAQRLHKPHERQALTVQWGGNCAAQNCCPQPQPGRKIIPHHVVPYSECGLTSLRDSVPLCEPSHQQLHDGHPIRLKSGRWIGPHGWLDPPAAA